MSLAIVTSIETEAKKLIADLKADLAKVETAAVAEEAKVKAAVAALEAKFEALVADIAANTGKPLGAFIAKYAPPSENETSEYLQVVSTLSGIGPDELL
jgi:hypothetical protein